MGCCCCRSKADAGITSLWVYDPETRSIAWKRSDGRNGVNDPFTCNATSLLQTGNHIAQARTLTSSAETARFVELANKLPEFMEETAEITAAGVNAHGEAYKPQSLPTYPLDNNLGTTLGGVATQLYWYVDELGNPELYYSWDPPGATPLGYFATTGVPAMERSLA